MLQQGDAFPLFLDLSSGSRTTLVSRPHGV
jgi:hypothetical protein